MEKTDLTPQPVADPALVTQLSDDAAFLGGAELRLESRRRFIRTALSGATMTALGGALYAFSDQLTVEAHASMKDGRPRLPPGQRVLERLKPMGGEPGDPNVSAFRFKVHGLVERPLEFTFSELVQLNPVELDLDVHCVTGWSVLGAKWKGVRVKDLAQRAGVQPKARHVIFEAAHGYTANVPLEIALRPDVLVSWQLDGNRLARAHGAPVRAVNPHLYFWKSAKWLTGIRFVEKDAPGYWEVRGYHNHADPWKEERHA
jgi:DMSO/TMAO reductase YedYZ molybdopterin-dependent catalytic subunit